MLRKLLDRPIMVTMMLLTVVVLGLVSMRLLPVSLVPEMDIPYITVQVSAPRLSAREVDRSVINVLRQHLIQIADLEDIRAEAKDGSGVIRLTFRQGSDIDYIFIEVNEKIDRSMGSLDSGIERPKVIKSGATDIPAFYINMTGRGEFPRLSHFAEEVVSKRIEQLPEVAMVDISGCVDDEILIVPDERALRRMGMTEDEFESCVASANVRLGNLTIRDGEYRYNVKFQSFATSRDDIADIYINRGGKIFQLKDIASVVEHPAARSGLVRANGQEAVTLAVIKQNSARMSDLRDGIGGLMDQFRQDYPDIDFEVTRDQTELLDYSISNLIRNIIAGILLACVVIFLFMQDFRSPALVVLTMPAALIFAMLVFHVIGLTINIISLSGLLLGVGMMVDNTIVLIDNMTARWQRGEPLREAVVRGATEVMAPMLSSVLTTVAVFIPLIFLSGVAGSMFYDEAMAITTVLFTSYIVTIVVVPVYYWWWYRGMEAFRPSPLLRRFSFDGIVAAYERGLEFLFRRRWIVWSLFGVSAALSAVCLAFMPKEKLPAMTYTDTLLRIDWNAPISLDRNEARVARIESIVGDRAESMTSMVGVQQFVLGHSGENSPSEALIYFKCADAATLDRTKADIEAFVRSEYPDAISSFRASGNIFDLIFAEQEPPLVARLRSTGGGEMTPADVRQAVACIAEAMPGTYVPDVVTKQDILYLADPERMALYDVSYSDLLAVLRNSLSENHIFEIIQGNNSIPVVMGVDLRDAGTLTDGATIRKRDMEIPVRELMRQTFDEDLKTLVSGAEGSYYPVEIDIPAREVPQAMGRIREAVHGIGGFDVSFSGSWFSSRKMTNELLIVLIVAVLLLYLILASQFESLVQPLIVLSEIVIDIGLSLSVLWVCGVSLNLMSLIGLVVICGIVINDSILKIDTINRLRSDGMGLEQSIKEAGQRRLKAIVMTSLTTILAVCPFLARGSMGADLQFPMSLVIIAGMVVGTLVSVFVVPIVYYVIYRDA